MRADHDPTAGASARAEYERRRDTRLAAHRRRFGRLAWLTSRIDGKSQPERAWLRGAEGEERAGRRLEQLVRDRGVTLLNDLRIPGTCANIDHLCVGPGGVTVIDTKRYRGKIQIRRRCLWVAGRNRTKLVEGVVKQVAIVRNALAARGLGDVDVVGAICWVEVDALPLLRRLELDGVRIDGPKPIAKLARRGGAMSRDEVAGIVRVLKSALGRDRSPRPPEI